MTAFKEATQPMQRRAAVMENSPQLGRVNTHEVDFRQLARLVVAKYNKQASDQCKQTPQQTTLYHQ